jgi:pyridoxine 5-phosphate synthase
MTKLSVNINKVATLRNTRPIGIPNVLKLSKIALGAGADGITVHPRPDQRHIRPADVYEIAQLLKSYPKAEFNIEGNPFDQFIHFARETRPAQCTLVPDDPTAATSDHGWNVIADGPRLKPIIKTLKDLGCRVSLFMDPDPEQITAAAKLGVDRIELYTAPFAEAFEREGSKAGDDYAAAAITAKNAGMGVNAGHDLNLENLPLLVQKIPFLAEVSIGHALIGDALEFGLAATVQKYQKALQLVQP